MSGTITEFGLQSLIEHHGRILNPIKSNGDLEYRNGIGFYIGGNPVEDGDTIKIEMGRYSPRFNVAYVNDGILKPKRPINCEPLLEAVFS